MKKWTWRRTAILVLAAAVGLAGCSGDNGGTVDPEAAAYLAAAKSAGDYTINDYRVHFEGRVFDGETTTFSYTVSGTGVGEPLRSFFLELPDCAPEPSDWSPTPATIGGFAEIDLYGIRWDQPLQPDDLEGRAYGVTFPGDVPLGATHAAVASADPTRVGVVPGPCAGDTVSGTVFVDINENGEFDPDLEGGIANVVIELRDADDVLQTALTDADGHYTITWLAGTYTVRLDTTATYAAFFNDDLGALWDARTPLERTVTIPPDAEGADFGFGPQAENIIEEIIQGGIVTDGLSTKFWINELQWAIIGGPDNPFDLPEDVLSYRAPVYSADELLEFLAQVQELALFEPYQFTPGEELEEALQILQVAPPVDEIDLLLRELLTTELNFVSDNGIQDDDGLLEALIAWGESVVIEALQVESPVPVEPEVRLAFQLFSQLNTGGGGGVDE